MAILICNISVIFNSSLLHTPHLYLQGPFYCAEGTIALAETKCMDGTLGGPDVSKLVDLTYSDARFNFIDDPSNLKNDKVFIFSGNVVNTSSQSS